MTILKMEKIEELQPEDLFLVYCVDKNIKIRTEIEAILKTEILSWSKILNKIPGNAISYEALLNGIHFVPKTKIRLLRDLAEKNEGRRKKWIKLSGFISDVLRENDIEHLFLKVPNHSLSLPSDVDVFVPEQEITKIAKILKQCGFKIHRYRTAYFRNFCAFNFNIFSEISPELIPLDFYTKFAVGVFEIGETSNVMESCASRRVAEFDEINLSIPSPEYELLFTSVHVAAHRHVRLTEFIHGLNLLYRYGKIMNWNQVFKIAERSRIAIPLLYYLLALNKYASTFYSQEALTEKIKRWITTRIYRSYPSQISYGIIRNQKLSFPLKVPYSVTPTLFPFLLIKNCKNKEAFHDWFNVMLVTYIREIFKDDVVYNVGSKLLGLFRSIRKSEN
jgi:hypothetical protein